MELKIEILKALESNRGKDVSGQALAEKLGVSRNAIWKAVNAMKREGYQIFAGQNRGYRLAEGNDMISAVGIAESIRHRTKGLAIYTHKEIDSTNNEAKRLIADGRNGMALIVSEGQTAGRGRQGKTFYSPAQTGIYMTFSFPTTLQMTDAVTVTSATAVAVFRAIRELTGIETEIKWVNDIYLGGKKICGILTEAISDFESGRVQNIIIGIGLNYRTTEFEGDLQYTAASLNPTGVNRNMMIARILDCLIDAMQNLGADEYMDLYRKHSMVIGHDVEYTVNGERYTGRAVDIDEDGGLVVLHSNGEKEVLRSGEITLRTR